MADPRYFALMLQMLQKYLNGFGDEPDDLVEQQKSEWLKFAKAVLNEAQVTASEVARLWRSPSAPSREFYAVRAKALQLIQQLEEAVKPFWEAPEFVRTYVEAAHEETDDALM